MIPLLPDPSLAAALPAMPAARVGGAINVGDAGVFAALLGTAAERTFAPSGDAGGAAVLSDPEGQSVAAINPLGPPVSALADVPSLGPRAELASASSGLAPQPLTPDARMASLAELARVEPVDGPVKPGTRDEEWAEGVDGTALPPGGNDVPPPPAAMRPEVLVPSVLPMVMPEAPAPPAPAPAPAPAPMPAPLSSPREATRLAPPALEAGLRPAPAPAAPVSPPGRQGAEPAAIPVGDGSPDRPEPSVRVDDPATPSSQTRAALPLPALMVPGAGAALPVSGRPDLRNQRLVAQSLPAPPDLSPKRPDEPYALLSAPIAPVISPPADPVVTVPDVGPAPVLKAAGRGVQPAPLVPDAAPQPQPGLRTDAVTPPERPSRGTRMQPVLPTVASVGPEASDEANPAPAPASAPAPSLPQVPSPAPRRALAQQDIIAAEPSQTAAADRSAHLRSSADRWPVSKAKASGVVPLEGPAPALPQPSPAAEVPAISASPSARTVPETGALLQPLVPPSSQPALAGEANGALLTEGRAQLTALDRRMDQLGDLREIQRAARPEVTMRHAEFGLVALRVETGAAQDWRAQLSSRDPGFVPAVQAALAERAIAAATAGSEAGMAFGQSQHGAADQRYAFSQGLSQGSAQPYLGQEPSGNEGRSPRPHDHRSAWEDGAKDGSGLARSRESEGEAGADGSRRRRNGGLFA